VFYCRLEMNISFEMFPIFYIVPQQGTVNVGYPCHKTFEGIFSVIILKLNILYKGKYFAHALTTCSA